MAGIPVARVGAGRPEAASAWGSFREGLEAPWAGLRYMGRHPALWRYGLFPVLVNLSFPVSSWYGLRRFQHLDFHSHGGSRAADPVLDPLIDVFVISALILVLVSFFVSVCGGVLLVLFTRRNRDLFWAIPAVNVLLYVLVVLLRPYPGGFGAQFRWPGLGFTLAEIMGLLALSLLLATAIALARLVLRGFRAAQSAIRSHGKAAPPSSTIPPGPAS